MKKLSEMLLEGQQKIDREDSNPTPTLVLFDNVLDPEKVQQSPEIDKIVTYFFGSSINSVLKTDNAEQLHDWFRDEQYKADIQDRAMIYRVKADFEDLALETNSDQFSGPLYMQIILPGDTTNNVLTITCQWGDGLFRNDYYVIGAVVDLKDMDRSINKEDRR